MKLKNFKIKKCLDVITDKNERIPFLLVETLDTKNFYYKINTEEVFTVDEFVELPIKEIIWF